MTGGDIRQKRGELAPQELRQTMAQAAEEQRKRQRGENWHAAIAAQRAQEEAERALWSNWWKSQKK